MACEIIRRIPWAMGCREWSAATGLVNFRARWYDAVTGRWLSKDPIGLNGGLNLYAFCGNDPIDYRDPLGNAHVQYRPLDAGDDKELQDLFDKMSTWDLPGDIDIRHAEIFFDDGKEPQHIGYGPDGIHSDKSDIPYTFSTANTYDDQTMRDAVNNLMNSGDWNPKGAQNGGSNPVFHNCQDFVSNAINEYGRLRK